MNRNIVAAFAAPAIAVVAAGVSAALASGVGLEARTAYGASLGALTAEDAARHAEATFARADLDGSGTLDADEYAALALVTAELARLNGFLALEIGDPARVVDLPIASTSALTRGERVRIEAVARSRFYAASGDDGELTIDEYRSQKITDFSIADRNRNGALSKAELAVFVAGQASIVGSDA